MRDELRHAENQGFFYLKPSDIRISESLDRYRKDMGDLKDLANSLTEFGQIQPCVINRENNLIAGGRRLAACIMAELEVKCVYEDTADPVRMRELEIEENLRRKQFTPGEEALALADLIEMKRARYGEPKYGPKKEGATLEDTGFTLDDAAAMVGKSRATVSSTLEMADAIKQFPELAKAKTKSAIKAGFKGLQKAAAVMEQKKNYEDQYDDNVERYTLVLGDAIEDMQSLEDKHIDILFTDPPYGISVDKVDKNLLQGFRYNDDVDRALIFYALLAKESFRFTKDDAHAFIFLAPEHFWRIREFFIAAGWFVHVRPIIWPNKFSNRNNAPYAWPSSCYEMVLYARKSDSRLVKQGWPDWIHEQETHKIFRPADSTTRIHDAEKPVNMLSWLLEKISMEGQFLYDPFAGSGAILEAGISRGLICRGVEELEIAHTAAQQRLISFCETLNKEKEDE